MQDRIAALERANEDLRCENHRMRNLIKGGVKVPPEWNLTSVETALARVLLSAEGAYVDHERLLFAMKQKGYKESLLGNLYAYVHRVRKKLHRFGITIKSERWTGYKLIRDRV